MYNNNLTHYIVVTGILVKDGKYLIVKRANWEKAFPGKWTFPGGKLEVLDYALRKKDTSDHWYNVLENLLERIKRRNWSRSEKYKLCCKYGVYTT